MRHPTSCLLLAAAVFCIVTTGHCLDEVRLAPPVSAHDQRCAYPYALLHRAMEATRGTDGPFLTVTLPAVMSRERALRELAAGNITVHVAATNPRWEAGAIAVRIPVLKGLLGYRLLLVREADLDIYAAVEDMDDLRPLRAGLGEQWTTTAIFRELGFTVATGTDYEGLFGMLALGRSDYFPRGINEIYAEWEERWHRYPELCIEPTLALYLPTPNYFFVSPRHPHLADRIRRGLELLIANGEFDAMFRERYTDAIERAGLGERRIIEIPNPLLTQETPLDRSELWFTP